MTLPPKRVLLQCRHSPPYPYPYPVEGDQVYCRQCSDYRTVEQHIDEYRVRCTGCRLSKLYGRDLGLARLVANRHIRKTGHTLSIWDGSKVLETLGPSDAQEQLPIETVRSHVGPEHQRMLKTLLNRDLK